MSSKLSKKLIDEINSASPELRDFIHVMESWDHSSQAFDLFNLKEEVRAQAWLIEKLRRPDSDLAGQAHMLSKILGMLRSEECAQHSNLACADDYADWLESQLKDESKGHKKTWACIKPDGDGCDGDHIEESK